MKVLLYLPTPGGLTGAPRRLINLALALKDNGLSVCIAADIGSQLFQEASKLGISTLPIHENGVLSLRNGALFTGGFVFKFRVLLALIWHNLKIWRAIRSYNADVVWIRASKGIAFAGVGTFCSGRPLIWDVDYELPSKGVIRHLHRFGLWLAKKVVFQYRSAPDSIFEKKLADKYREKFVSIIPGIDFSELEVYRRERKKWYKNKSSEFMVLQIGTICERKNQKLILNALKTIDLDNLQRKVCVKFLGGLADTRYVEDIRGFIAESGLEGYVEIVGWDDNVYKWMVQADLLLMPSKDEGVPNTVQEAMYIGLPVLVSDAGGMPEIVDNGKTGWIVPLHEPESWAYKIIQIMDDSDMCADVASAASCYASERFDMEKWGREYAGLIVRLLEK